MFMAVAGRLPCVLRCLERHPVAAAGDYEMLPEEWSHVSQQGQKLVKKLLSYKPAGGYAAVLDASGAQSTCR